MQRIVSTCYHGINVSFWKCWLLLVKRRLYAGCTIKKKGHPNIQKLPDGADCFHTQRPDGHIGWQPGKVGGSSLVTITLWFTFCPMHRRCKRALKYTHKACCNVHIWKPNLDPRMHCNMSSWVCTLGICHVWSVRFSRMHVEKQSSSESVSIVWLESTGKHDT